MDKILWITLSYQVVLVKLGWGKEELGTSRAYPCVNLLWKRFFPCQKPFAIKLAARKFLYLCCCRLMPHLYQLYRFRAHGSEACLILPNLLAHAENPRKRGNAGHKRVAMHHREQ